MKRTLQLIVDKNSRVVAFSQFAHPEPGRMGARIRPVSAEHKLHELDLPPDFPVCATVEEWKEALGPVLRRHGWHLREPGERPRGEGTESTK